jgi:hypothetical protein
MSPLIVLAFVIGASADIPADAPGTASIVAFDEAGHAVAVDVLVGGASVRTPAVVRLAPGRHTFVAVIDGAERPLPSLVLRAGEHLDVVIDTGALAVDVGDPLDAPGLDTAAAGATPAGPESTGPESTGARAEVRLRVRSLVDEQPLAGARIWVRGGAELGATDDSGRVQATLPAGEATLSVVQPGFVPRVVTLTLRPDDAVDVDVQLAPLAEELDELTVRAPHIGGGAAAAAGERRAQKQLVEVLGADQMKKSGDGDAAQALRRVTGLTVVGGRYVYVRGLGDRYSSTLVNGAVLPSPEPERRVVPLDLFPSALLESVVVQKTWSPDLPGEFGGGSVQLRTRVDARPAGDDERPLLTVGVSTGAQLGTTFTEQLQSPTGALDLLAMDDGSRALPADVRAASDGAPIAEGNALTGGGLDKKELERLGEQITPAWSPRRALVLPALGANAAVGHSFLTPVGRIGALASFTWNTETLHTETSRQLTASSGSDVVVTDDLSVASTERSTNLGMIGALSWTAAPRQVVRAVTLLNRSADDEARVVEGYDADTDEQLRLTRLRFVARQLFVQQLLGEHALPWAPFTDELQLRWRAGYALALRDEPGQRLTRYDASTSAAGERRSLLSDRSDGNQLLASGLTEHSGEGALTLRVPFASWTHDAAAVDVGVFASGRARDVDTRRFKFLFTGPRASDTAVRAQAPEDVFTPANIGADGFTLGEATRNTDNHTGNAAIGAAFVAVDLPVFADVVVTGGLRVEASRLQVTTFELFNAAAPPVVAELANVDVLPALGVAWTLLDDLTLKSAAARTVVRPELRELSPAVYTDVAGGRARFGNPALQSTAITHGDLRLEWAWSARDGASVAVFGKYFERPIESVVTSGADQAITAANVDAAFNIGAEFEGRLSLLALPFGEAVRTAAASTAPLLGSVLAGLWVGGNAALVDSRVFIGPEQQGTLTSTERPLEGQSPWIVNGQLGFDDDERGSSVALLYNVFGPRVVEVGALGLPDCYEQPFHQLDLVLRQRVGAGFTLSVRAANLIDPAATRTLGGRTVDEVRRGRTLTAGLQWTW